MGLFLGVDGGATRTRAVVANDAYKVLGVGMAGGSNWPLVGIFAAGQAIRESVEKALSAAGAGARDLDAGYFGLAGVDWPSDVDRLGGVLFQLGLRGTTKITNDSFVALRAGTSGPAGVVVIAGSGSVAAGRNAAGEVFRTLGLGPDYGELGGETDISTAAIRAVAVEYTGRGPRTALTERIAAAAGCASAAELLETVNRGQAAAEGFVANRLASIVFAAADDGDAVAREISTRAGTSLGESVALVIRRLAMSAEPVEVVCAGGLMQKAHPALRGPLESVARRAASGATFVTLQTPPAVGAVLLAMELAGVSTTDGGRATLATGVGAALRQTAG